jgi:hypothetical protein
VAQRVQPVALDRVEERAALGGRPDHACRRPPAGLPPPLDPRVGPQQRAALGHLELDRAGRVDRDQAPLDRIGQGGGQAAPRTGRTSRRGPSGPGAGICRGRRDGPSGGRGRSNLGTVSMGSFLPAAASPAAFTRPRLCGARRFIGVFLRWRRPPSRRRPGDEPSLACLLHIELRSGLGDPFGILDSFGVRETKVSLGVDELEVGAEPMGRARRSVGDRKRAADLDPGLVPALRALVEPDDWRLSSPDLWEPRGAIPRGHPT